MDIKKPEALWLLGFVWRRVRDLNPRCAVNAHTISSRAPSTTRPTLQILHFSNVANYSMQFDEMQVEFFVNSQREIVHKWRNNK